MYLGSLEAGRSSILCANFAVIDVIRAHFPDAEENDNLRIQSCLNDIDRDITVLRRLIELCTPDPVAGAPGESIASPGRSDDVPPDDGRRTLSSKLQPQPAPSLSQHQVRI